jgi:hypothetical protein
VRLSKANATTLYALVQEQGVLKTTVTLTGSSQVALARNPRRANTAVARQDPAQYPAPSPAPSYEQQQQYSDAGEPVVLTPQPQLLPGRQIVPQQRPDDGYIYPADGSDEARYPAPRSSRRIYGAQAYPQPQPQYDRPQYDNGYAPAPQQQQGYYQPQPRSFLQPRGY